MNIANLSNEFSQLSLEDSLKKITEVFTEGVVFSSSFGQEDQAITHAIFKQKLPIRVFSLDTGRLFPETYELIEKTLVRYNEKIEFYFPNTEAVQNLTTEKGMFSFYESVENRKECCHVRKIEPLSRALIGAKVWITGIRADQSDNRSDMAMFEEDHTKNILKFNPLINWSLDKVKEYINTHKIPENTLHKKDFVSIGCGPCTRAIMPGEDPRAGRWSWESSKKECGLHAS